MMQTTARRSQPVTAASRLLAQLSRHGLRELLDEQTAMDLEVVAGFTIQQHVCACARDERSHLVGDDCPPHPLHPRN